MVESEYGIVREVEGDGAARESATEIVVRAASEPRYGIEITIPGVCESCAVKGNCYGAGSMVWAESDEALRPGDYVRLDMKQGTVLKATGWVYGIPLVSVVLGTLAGYRWLFSGRPEEPRVLLSFALGVGLMIAAGFVLSKLNDWIGRRLTIRAHRASPPSIDG
jgi:positive regulator of sigma E activity